MLNFKHRVRKAGFSLVEILITLLVFSTITMGLLLVFDNSSRLARSQTQLAMLQQNQRVGHSELVRYVKMAGLGGLPLSLINPSTAQKETAARRYKEVGMFPRGFAIEVINNIDSGRKINSLDSAGGSGGDTVLAGSDVLIVRGVFSTPVYYVAEPILNINDSADGPCTPASAGSICLTDSGKKVEGTLLIPSKVRAVDVAGRDLGQDLGPLSAWFAPWIDIDYSDPDTDQNRIPYGEAFIMRDVLNPNAYVIAALDLDRFKANPSLLKAAPCLYEGDVLGSPNPECVSIPIKLDRNVDLGERYADLMLGTSLVSGAGLTSMPGVPSADREIEIPSKVTSIGLLEEYRFYVSDNPGDHRRILKRARFLPGTETEVDNIVVADNVVDLQIAIGVDTDSSDAGDDYGQVTDSGSADDEVLFNHENDYNGPPEAPTYAPPPNLDPSEAVWYHEELRFHFLRINTLVQSEQRDIRYQAPELTAIEDYLRTDYNETEERQLQRRWLQTVVELRNLQ